jgi:hypothetical protein
MNYTVIIILIVLLFVIYQLKTSEKKEGFDIVNSKSKVCPTGTASFGGIFSDLCKDYTDTARCPSGFVVGGINGRMNSRCVKSEDDYALCPIGFELDTFSGKCRKTLPLPSCPPETTWVGNNCRKWGTVVKSKICPDGLLFAKNPNNTLNTTKCCPPNAPYYRKGNNTNIYKCHTNPT